ncbi:XdhC family protein [Thiorhodovibrio frisius]|uniref:Xanthine and CO dehydrogenases maturation factor, XdhC/CoxF family n=1 Tax=Thiorhodovibrio frisius TaxID=631362 RepID=H8Z6X6_9GAMM|nr:XdhC family protein [Thiorhodovibrio frisius]EIC19761.1 xanthine and CO dehydrogenases maturation factor, XdhC/CoxF family [Thiorhodovibrio frisius]WPL20269.1 putative xanthine dehydrogenase subunit A [Thiorhodovibrio frisius]
MIPADQAILEAAVDWLRAGRSVHLIMVLRTWGSSPRPVGSLWALAEDGASVGSISGGCLEDEVTRRLREAAPLPQPEILRYGVTADEARRFGLPCGGQVELLAEQLTDPHPLQSILDTLSERRRIARRIDLADGTTRLIPATRDTVAVQREDGAVLRLFGPVWRLLLIGDGAIARLVAEMAQALDIEVILCDPRIEDPAGWSLPGVRLETTMPDDAVLAHATDPRSAVMTLAHDPRLDDLALLEALQADTGYVGALGSRASNAQRRERLATLGVPEHRLARLRGPIGLGIGGRTPAEIAISAIAELVAVRNGSPLAQREPDPADKDRDGSAGTASAAAAAAGTAAQA